MQTHKMQPFSFQEKTWERYFNGYSGMVIAPTGFGKTFSVFLGVLIDFMNRPECYKSGLKLVWVTPIRSLAKDLAKAMQTAINDIGLDWIVEVRNGDTDAKVKQRQTKSMPDILLLTPESLHLLIAQKSRNIFFKNLQCIVIDEWHELLSTKRGVMVELAVAFLKGQNKQLKTWGITATIGNVDQAMEVLLASQSKTTKIVSKEKKPIEIVPVYP
ncbi:MAG: DEAD/DEAH box helicase, partial [Pedobacter sp.]